MSVSFQVQVSKFPPGSQWAHLNGRASQTFSWSSILRAAMVAGYPDLASIPSIQFARWRTAALHMALRRASGQLIQPPEWRQLDPSEKAAVSSILGVVVTKLLVERFLNAPLFLFLDVHFLLTFPPGVKRIRPDFAAMTPTGDWFSVEAKGRSRFLQKTLENGKLQARALGTVNSQPVQTGVVCVTSFRGGQMEARFADPTPVPRESLGAQIEPMEAVWSYYSQLYRFKEFSEAKGEAVIENSDLHVRLWRSLEMDVDFGIIPPLEKAIEERAPEKVMAVLKHLAGHGMAHRNPYLGADGIVVIPGKSWQT